MKFNKVLSSALVFVMLFASLVCAFPVSAFAEEGSKVVVNTDNLVGAVITPDQVKNIILGGDVLNPDGTERTEIGSINYNYATAEEMLEDELEKGYLVWASAGNYTVYVNYYTGFSYYKNNKTGQVLTSNPIDPAYKNALADTKYELMSQIELVVSEKANAAAESKYNSIKWILEGALLEVSAIEGEGISVKYTLGDVSDYFAAPGAILSEDFKNDICKPLFENYAALIERYCGPFDAQIAAQVFEVELQSYNIGDHSAIEYTDEARLGQYVVKNINNYLRGLLTYAEKALAAKGLTTESNEYKLIKSFYSDVTVLFIDGGYSLIGPFNRDFLADNIKNEVAAIGEGKFVYKIPDNSNVDILRSVDKAIKTATNKTYSKEKADQHEANCGYNPKNLATPCVNVVIRYLLDENGMLTIDIPADPENITFDRTLFDVTSITPLKYFGCGDMSKNGYILYPDGSGTIVEFSDFYSDSGNTGIYVESPVYGNDYVYSTITGAHREQVTMPVYGLVNDCKIGTEETGYKSVTNGCFTVIETGASTASLCFESGGGTNKYATAYSIIRPYPSDKYDLSQSLSVSGLGYYYVVAEKGYEESYKYRINMLTDENNAQETGYLAEEDFYPSDYAGMAACYRDYLEANGQIEALSEFSEDLPLYIEALGSMDIIKRILTFPVTVSTSLTTFDHVETIYNELSDITEAKKKLEEKADSYREKAEEVKANNIILSPDDQALIDAYNDKADHYDELVNKIYDIKNINFRLTGFANGGMYFTYPSKVKWEKSVGGKRGFKDLLSAAEQVNAKKDEGYNFGIFPDFDFLFINNTAAFDGISQNTAARMVDNRYASKQSYNSILQKYESLFALVLSTDSLDKLYTKFEKKYSKYDIDTMSVSTLGSTLNSNFDKENIINRETALGHVTSVLDRMAESYTLMTDKGNIYSVKYADHILNASIDSSHFRYSSFAIPFYGMVLHGYVNYAGSALTYAGSPDYNILRSIESGASLYYILCYENTNHLKEDELLSKYYGIDYANWQENILENYAVVNNAIGDLQKYIIADHTSLIAERIIDNDEMLINYERLVDEFLSELSPSIEDRIDEAVAANPDNRNGYYLVIDKEDIKAVVDELLATYSDEAGKNEIKADAYKKIDEIIARLEARFPEKTDAVVVNINGDSIVYKSQYSYVTDSVANAENYKKTEFTCDNGSVVMVVYQDKDSGDEVVFLLNYNNFAVNVNVDGTIDQKLGEENKVYTLGAYGCYKITSTESIEIK